MNIFLFMYLCRDRPVTERKRNADGTGTGWSRNGDGTEDAMVTKYPGFINLLIISVENVLVLFDKI
jgi:hypothetical protein